MTIAEQPRTRKQALNVRDLAEIIQVEEGTVRRHIRQGDIPYFRVGMILRFDPSDISDWLEGNSLSPRVANGGYKKKLLDRVLFADASIG
jgi:excisionase family DNA binding protein